MGIFSFFKRKNKNIVKEIEIVNQNELFEWIKNKKDQYSKKEKEFLLPIKERMNLFISDLKSIIVILENVDIENRKVNERVKLIVKENLKNYIGHLNKVIQKLNGINKRDEFIENINIIFRDFENKSNISYQKASFLLIKDIQQTKNIIRKFLSDLEIILKNNKNYTQKFDVINIINNYIEESNYIKKNKNKILNDLNSHNKLLKNLKFDLKKKEKETEELKNSNKFKVEERRKEKFEIDKKELNKEIDELRALIDFKSLSHFYHKFNREMKWVKEYKDNFKYALENLKLEKLTTLLKESKLDTPKILESIDKIHNKEIEILDTSFVDIGIDNLLNDIKKINFNISEIKSEKITKENKIRILDESIDKIIVKIKKELSKINVELK